MSVSTLFDILLVLVALLITWFVLHELLGQPNVKNYDGSWTEYGSLVGVPVSIGAEPGDPEGSRA